MRRLTKLGASAAAIAALAAGGAAIAGAAGNPNPPISPPAAVQPLDGDNVQQGDQSTPDTDSTIEKSSEGPAASETGSEIAGNDGPGGHADEPGNATPDYQFQGEQ